MTPTRLLLSSALLLLAVMNCRSSSDATDPIRPDPGAQAGASAPAGQGGSTSHAGSAGAAGSLVTAGAAGTLVTAGAAGSAGTPVTAGAAGTPASTAHCPTSERGPLMVLIDGPSGPYCLDRTEVTQAQYKAFLAEVGTGKVSPTKDTAYLFDFVQCATANTSFRPQDGGEGSNCGPGLLPDRPEMPMECVDVCDAYAFCRWSGKRLCGQAGGKPGSQQTATVPASSEWMWACTNGGSTKLPMGDDYTNGTCVDQTFTSKMDNWKVGDHAGCRGQGEPYESILDQVGSVAEFTAECTTPETPGTYSNCMFRGGLLTQPIDQLTCNTPSYSAFSLTDASYGIGIRCCADAVE